MRFARTCTVCRGSYEIKPGLKLGDIKLFSCGKPKCDDQIMGDRLMKAADVLEVEENQKRERRASRKKRKRPGKEAAN